MSRRIERFPSTPVRDAEQAANDGQPPLIGHCRKRLSSHYSNTVTCIRLALRRWCCVGVGSLDLRKPLSRCTQHLHGKVLLPLVTHAQHECQEHDDDLLQLSEARHALAKVHLLAIGNVDGKASGDVVTSMALSRAALELAGFADR